jgi:hypothetical protein
MSYPNWLGEPESPLYDVPSPTQINGTGPTVDLVPNVILFAEFPSFYPLSDIAGTINILYTDTTLRQAGTYLVMANFAFKTELAAWASSESMILDICTTNTANVSIIPNLTLQPGYFNDNNSIPKELELAIVGLIKLTGPAYLNARATRQGTLSANKVGGIQSFTAQKIA